VNENGNDSDTHYEVLGVDPGSTKDEIRDAYRERLLEAQAAVTREETAKRPSGSSIAAARAEEKEVRGAWQVLSDPMQRERYDTAHGIEPRDTSEDADDVEDDVEDDDEDDGRPARPVTKRGAIPTFLDGHELAPSGRRAVAAFIDLAIVGIAAGAIIGIGALMTTNGKNGNASTVQGIVTAVALAVLLAYFVIPTTLSGQTVGKRLTHIVVVDRETGDLPRVSRVITRYAIPIMCLLLLGFFGALLAIMAGVSFLMSKELISLGDRLGKTIVIVARYKPQRTSF
jgi:uncharacterized RDD family membrane protein YckC